VTNDTVAWASVSLSVCYVDDYLPEDGTAMWSTLRYTLVWVLLNFWQKVSGKDYALTVLAVHFDTNMLTFEWCTTSVLLIYDLQRRSKRSVIPLSQQISLLSDQQHCIALLNSFPNHKEQGNNGFQFYGTLYRFSFWQPSAKKLLLEVTMMMVGPLPNNSGLLLILLLASALRAVAGQPSNSFIICIV